MGILASKPEASKICDHRERLRTSEHLETLWKAWNCAGVSLWYLARNSARNSASSLVVILMGKPWSEPLRSQAPHVSEHLMGEADECRMSLILEAVLRNSRGSVGGVSTEEGGVNCFSPELELDSEAGLGKAYGVGGRGWIVLRNVGGRAAESL